jgi:phosphohistidine phosphatase
MDLYLLRHADADTIAARDDLRFLSEKGRGQAQKVGRFCFERQFRPDLILTSPLTRTLQTARIVAEQMEMTECVVVEPFLRAGMMPEAAFSGLEKYEEKSGLLIVGHEPDFGILTSTLLGAFSETIHVRKASLLKIYVASLSIGGGILEFLLPVKFL